MVTVPVTVAVPYLDDVSLPAAAGRKNSFFFLVIAAPWVQCHLMSHRFAEPVCALLGGMAAVDDVLNVGMRIHTIASCIVLSCCPVR